MDFRTEINPKNFDFKINHSNKIMLLGSCFTEHISQKLSERKFKIKSNPLGIMFHPKAIFKTLNRVINGFYFSENEMFEQNGRFYCYDAHSQFNGSSAAELTEKLNTELTKAIDWLKSSDYLFITFGTSWIYRLKETREVVANCHKSPNNLFQKELLDPKRAHEIFYGLKQKLKKFNPNLKIVFTISPVRHWRDGHFENQLSKGLLFQCVYHFINQFKACYYFPAYEIVMDDLRDYRFYESDLIHPNQLAINYMWEKFENCFFEPKTLEINQEIEKISKAQNHLAFNPETEEHKKFLKSIEKNIENFQKKYPEINL